jgi:hypothetical protein
VWKNNLFRDGADAAIINILGLAGFHLRTRLLHASCAAGLKCGSALERQPIRQAARPVD